MIENRMVGGDKKNQYSFTRALKNLMQEGEAPFEREISRDAERRFGVPMHGGLLIPLDMPIEMRSGLVANTNSAGGFAVQTSVMPLIELLRNQMVVRKAGATIMEGLRDTLSFPKQLTPGTATWVAENPGADVADADLTLGSVGMSPKMLTSTTSYSRKLLAQSSVDIEAMVRNDLIATSAIALDLAALIGTGSSNQPTGILNTSGVNVIAYGVDGGAPTYADVVSMETMLNTSNVPVGETRAYVITPEVLSYGRRTAKVSGQLLGTIVAEDGRMNGFPVFVTNQLPKNLTRGAKSDCHVGIFGEWSYLMIGLWGGAIELIVDPYRLKKQGEIEITSYLMADIAVRQPVAFSVSKFWSASLL